ncbi:MAG: transposase [Gammaproteobacteria bacterium]|nr:transposase [Gammaproteobacteria bacterium]
MAKPRYRIINTDLTPSYHVMARCVRRAFLCGYDEFTGRSFDHRKDWIIEQLARLSHAFCIDILAYAIMSNHYHLVLRVNLAELSAQSNQQVVERWLSVFAGQPCHRAYLNGEMGDEQREAFEQQTVQELRKRLGEISWFMNKLNQCIALRANQEDQAKGHFFEARFNSQALLDDAALTACMAYVDLNPIRAGIAEQLADSHYTSIKQRLEGLNPHTPKTQPSSLFPKLCRFDPSTHADALPFSLEAYTQLLEWTAKRSWPIQPGAIKGRIPNLLLDLKLNPVQFKQHLPALSKSHSHWLGSTEQLQHIALALAQRTVKGIGKLTAIS